MPRLLPARLLSAGLLLLLLHAPAQAASPLVVELFTSQGCSSCPPADALLARLRRERPDVLVLGFHVTYWDRLGWKDPYSLPEATQRQRAHARALRLDSVYTPQMVVQGRHDVVGFDRRAVLAALDRAQAEATPVALTLAATPEGLTLEAGAGQGRARLLLVGYDAQHVTPVGRGENSGRTLTEVNVVRSIAPVGAWTGAPLRLALPRPLGESAAVLLQAEDGRILAAANVN